jgi:ribosome-binding ATPase YchF (GTP1/OBG family)
MKIAIVGYQGVGKSTLFEWLTQTAADLSLAHTTQLAAAVVRDPRVDQLARIYSPKKITHASIQLVDTPGLSRGDEENAARLAQLRDAGALVVVLGAFRGRPPHEEWASFQDDLLLADLLIVTGRLERLEESVKKPRPQRAEEMAQIQDLRPIVAHLDQGRPLRELKLDDRQQRTIKSFQLLTDKPHWIIVNASEDQPPGHIDIDGESCRMIPLRLQHELASLPDDEREAFCREMQVTAVNRDDLLREIMIASGQMLFFTCGEKEVRSWLIDKGATAEDAAAAIHTDLAKTFVRAERMTCADLLRLGSEREVKAHNLMFKEFRGYVVQDGDVLHILASS